MIFDKIEKPNNNKIKKEKKNKLTKKEKQVIRHLKHTYELVGNLNNNDIRAMEIIKTKRMEEKQKERE